MQSDAWLRTYITRRDLNGVASYLVEKITREEALYLYDINGAYGTFEEDIKVLLTVIDDKPVFQRG